MGRNKEKGLSIRIWKGHGDSSAAGSLRICGIRCRRV